MGNIKRITGIAALAIAALVLCVLATVGAYAVETGNISVNNAKVGQTYTVYRILDLESYNVQNDAYAYKVDPAWTDLFDGDDIKDVYVEIDKQGYVTWKTGADQQEFAQKACTWAVANKVANQGSTKATSTTVEFKGLALGYYLMDSSMGALCALDTTNPDVTLEEKNFEPTIEKKVNRGGEAYGDANTAKVGDQVLFRTVVAADAGAQNYVVHDTMSTGLTFEGIPETVKSGTVDIPAVYYRHSGPDSSEYELVAGQDYNVVTNPGDGCTFHVAFTESFLQSITDKIYINIHYYGRLNSQAVVGDGGNGNESHLTYGDGQTTTTDVTKTYTYQFNLVKIDSGKNILSGASFKLYDSKMDGNEIALIDLGESEYRVATPAEKATEGFKSATVTAGVATIQGLANGTYYLQEIDAPDGYNKLDARVAVNIADANNMATFNAEKTSYVAGGVSVVNRTGTILPRTGGMGTILFYGVGGVIVIAAIVLGVSRVRKNRNHTDI